MAAAPAAWWAAGGVVVVGALIWALAGPPPGLPPALRPATGFVVLALLTVCAITDLVWRWVFNWATYPAAVAGLALALAADVTPAEWHVGPHLAGHGVLDALTGFGVAFAAMLVLHALFGGGGGDVKLVTAVGALMGWSVGLQTILYGFVFAGAAAVLVILWRMTGPPQPGTAAGSTRWGGADRFKGHLPMAPFLAAGALVAVALT